MELQFKHLDEEELIHFAANASQQGRQDAAIGALKEVLSRNPKHAKALYLLAAEHAELGLYQRAIKGMEDAVMYEPALYAASLQLGLLHLTLAQTDASKAVLQPLADEEHAHFYQSFAKGLLALQVDDFQVCAQCMLVGIAQNQINAPLNKDMQRILDALIAKGLWSGTLDVPTAQGTEHGEIVVGQDGAQAGEQATRNAVSTDAGNAKADAPTVNATLGSLWLSAYQQDEVHSEPQLVAEPRLDDAEPPKGSLH